MCSYFEVTVELPERLDFNPPIPMIMSPRPPMGGLKLKKGISNLLHANAEFTTAEDSQSKGQGLFVLFVPYMENSLSGSWKPTALEPYGTQTRSIGLFACDLAEEKRNLL